MSTVSVGGTWMMVDFWSCLSCLAEFLSSSKATSTQSWGATMKTLFNLTHFLKALTLNKSWSEFLYSSYFTMKIKP